MQKYLFWVPNALTLLNLLMGCIAIRYALADNLADASWFILAALNFDFFDGFSARMLKVQSEIGKQLDSLADMVTFGIAPSMILFVMSTDSKNHAKFDTWAWGYSDYICYLAFAVALASAWRLAVFNNDESQTNSFKGLPTPANAMIICSLPWIAQMPDFPLLYNQLQNPWFLILIMALCTWLPVSNLKLLALKFKSFDFKTNANKYIVLIFGISSFAILGLAGLLPAIVVYILISLFWPDKNLI